MTETVSKKLVVLGPQHTRAVERGADCQSCPLANCGRGPVHGEIRANAPVIFVGDAPGRHDVEARRPFEGPSGRILERAIDQGGMRRSQVSITNAILCQPPGGNLQEYLKELQYQHKIATLKYEAAVEAGESPEPVPPLVLPTTACYGRLVNDIKESNSITQVGVGGEALRALADFHEVPFGQAAKKAKPGEPRLATIKKQHGSPCITKNGITIMASLHPQFAMFGNAHYAEVIRDDLKRAVEIAGRGGKINWSEPNYYVKPDPTTIHAVLNEMMRDPATRITIDIETSGKSVYKDHVRCVGLGATKWVWDEASQKHVKWELVIVIPLRHINGKRWWAKHVEDAIRQHIRALLDTHNWDGQNLAFDTAKMLMSDELLISDTIENRQRVWADTMIAHHNTRQSELPHDLGFIAARNTEAPRWKDDADVKSGEDTTDDYTLHLYCAKDVLGEMRLVQPLIDQVITSGCLSAFETDTELAPVARDMGALGLNINEDKRKEFYVKTTTVSQKKLKEIREIVGDEKFNPNSPRQVARWLYVKNRITPAFDANGDDWTQEEPDDTLAEDGADELERASTNESALLALVDRGVEPRITQFIEAQLQFRGMEKIRGTYLGYKPGDKDAKDIEKRGVIIPGIDHEVFGKLVDKHRERNFIIDEFRLGQNLAIFHPTWKIHITPTGRWATSPNVQNWPERVVFDPELYRATEGKEGIINIREMVEAPTGYCLVGADYAAIELRIYAAVAGDQALLDVISGAPYIGQILKCDPLPGGGYDPHAWNYATMQGGTNWEAVAHWYRYVVNAPDKIRKHCRNIAKRLFFLCVYGGQKDKLFKTMSADRNPDGTRSFPGLTPEEVFFWFDNLHAAHPEIRRWQKSVIAAWEDAGYVASQIDFRKRFFLGGLDPTAMPNHTIQSTAAAIMNYAMRQIARACPHRGWGEMAGPILQVHDYVGLQVPCRLQTPAEELLDQAMPNKCNGFPIVIERKTAGWTAKDKKTGKMVATRPSWDRT